MNPITYSYTFTCRECGSTATRGPYAYLAYPSFQFLHPIAPDGWVDYGIAGLWCDKHEVTWRDPACTCTGCRA